MGNTEKKEIVTPPASLPRTRAPVSADLEPLDGLSFAGDDARGAALRNAHRLCLMALERTRKWVDQKGNEREATEPDLPSAIKCLELASKLQGLMPEASKGFKPVDQPTGADWDSLVQDLRKAGYDVVPRAKS